MSADQHQKMSISLSPSNPQVKDPVEAWADMEDMVRNGVAKARGGEEESIQVNARLRIVLIGLLKSRLN